jgi:pimeloyl-ACP methyl ester carboxylesterase
MKRSLSCLAAVALLTASFAAPTQAAPPAAAQSAPRFSVTVEGAGPDVIFIPGLMSSRAVWDDAVGSLGSRYRVHRLQIGGFAGEPAGGNGEGRLLAGVVEALHAYIAKQGLHRPRLVGHSLGGLLELMLAQAYPDDVGPMLIVEALPFYGALFGAASDAGFEPNAAALRGQILGMTDDAFRTQQLAGTSALARSPEARRKILDCRSPQIARSWRRRSMRMRPPTCALGSRRSACRSPSSTPPGPVNRARVSPSFTAANMPARRA